jgi:hypothetical protein
LKIILGFLAEDDYKWSNRIPTICAVKHVYQRRLAGKSDRLNELLLFSQSINQQISHSLKFST